MAIIFKYISLLVCLSLLSCTSSLVYQPDKYLYSHPSQFSAEFEAFTINSLDGTKLSAWKIFSKKKPAKNLVLYFHGNAQNLTSHFVNLVWLIHHETDVVIFDYRGYGLSEGSPEPKGVYEDGLSFLNHTYEDFKKNNYKKFIVYTQSLGGAVAMRSLEDFAHRSEIDLLVLDSTFRSPRDVAREKTNRFLSYIVSDDYTAKVDLSHLTMPVLSIHSYNDPVIAESLGEELHKNVPAFIKHSWRFKDKGHGDVFFIKNEEYRLKFLKFLDN